MEMKIQKISLKNIASLQFTQSKRSRGKMMKIHNIPSPNISKEKKERLKILIELRKKARSTSPNPDTSKTKKEESVKKEEISKEKEEAKTEPPKNAMQLRFRQYLMKMAQNEANKKGVEYFRQALLNLSLRALRRSKYFKKVERKLKLFEFDGDSKMIKA